MHRLSSASATRGKTWAGACGQPATRPPGPVDARAPGRLGVRSVELGCGRVQLDPPGATGIEGGLRLGDGLVIPTGPCGLELLLEFDDRILELAERSGGAGLRLRVAALPRSLLGLGQGALDLAQTVLHPRNIGPRHLAGLFPRVLNGA